MNNVMAHCTFTEEILHRKLCFLCSARLKDIRKFLVHFDVPLLPYKCPLSVDLSPYPCPCAHTLTIKMKKKNIETLKLFTNY